MRPSSRKRTDEIARVDQPGSVDRIRTLAIQRGPFMEEVSHPMSDPDRSHVRAMTPSGTLCFWCRRGDCAGGTIVAHPSDRIACAAVRLLDMDGIFPLDHAAIDERIAEESPGNYALGYLDGNDFVVFYVGRSDGDLRAKLHDWVGTPSRSAHHATVAKAAWGGRRRGASPLDSPAPARVSDADGHYTHFAYSHAACSEEAHAKEWRNYDAFGGRHVLDNEVDPLPIPPHFFHA
jgi:hypothetical protein